MSRAVLAPFEAYQKARVTFVQTVAELAQRPQNIEALQSAGKSSLDSQQQLHLNLKMKLTNFERFFYQVSWLF